HRRFRLHKLPTRWGSRSKSRDLLSWHVRSDGAPDTALWSACRSCWNPGATAPNAAVEHTTQAQPAEREMFSWPSTQSRVDSPRPFRLPLRWLPRSGPANHVIDEIRFIPAQTRGTVLTERRHRMPRRNSVNAAKPIFVVVLLGLDRAHAVSAPGLIASIIKLLHLGFGKLAAISLLDQISERVDVSTLSFEDARDRARGSKSFPLLIAGEQTNKACQLAAG